MTVSLGLFFALLLLRLVLAARRGTGRRTARIVLAGSLLAWATGSAILNAVAQPDLTHFPSPGETLFLLSYAGMAAFLGIDAPTRRVAAAGAWLETIVVCGGAACTAGAVLLLPAAQRLGTDGLPLLLALLYPLADVLLALFVVGQVLLGLRHWREAAALVSGFFMFAAADTSFVLHLPGDTYSYGLVNIDLWGVGFLLIVGSACRARNLTIPPAREKGLTGLVVAAGLAAACVLAFEPSGSIRRDLILPAVGTLAAAGFRLASALRQASRATEAIALSRSDDLTELPNRRAVVHALDEAIAAQRGLGLMILDLDGFKEVNDTLGHAAGDAVLCEVADRLRRVVPENVVIARLGGDEFAAVIPTSGEIELMELAQTILRQMREPMQVDGIAVPSAASIGITVADGRDTSTSEVLRRADVAMYDAKRKRLGAVLYDPAVDVFSRDRLQLGDELRSAIADGRIELWYQPQLDVETGQLCGLEALVRWRHPTRGVLSPGLFLPVARRAGLMQLLSEEIGRLAVADLLRWQAQGVTVNVAINCAPPELLSRIFLPKLQTMLEAANLPASRITIEVTEDSFISEPEGARELLGELRRRGFELSIDDFGTGFSSLSYLRDLPVQELKVDRSFVSTCCTDPRSRMIIAATVQLAHGLGLRVVAEGVEDSQTAADLMALGVDVLQGFHLGRPMPAPEVPRWARQIDDLIA